MLRKSTADNSVGRGGEEGGTLRIRKVRSGLLPSWRLGQLAYLFRCSEYAVLVYGIGKSYWDVVFTIAIITIRNIRDSAYSQ